MLVLGAAHLHHSVGELERRLERIGEAAPVFRANNESIDDDFDRVVLSPVELRWIRYLDQLTVDIRADEPLLTHVLEELAKLAFPTLHERRADLDARVRRPGENDVGDLPR